MLPESPDYGELLDLMSDGVCFAGPDGKVLYWNASAERIVGCSSDEALGESATDLLVLYDKKDKRLPLEQCPVVRALLDGQACEAEGALLRKGGGSASVRLWATPLRDAAGNVGGVAVAIIEKAQRQSLAERVAELEKQAFVDPLTWLPNRRYAEKRLKDRFGEWRRYGWPFGVIMADIDRFKPVNDAFGHAAGDAVLKTVGRVLQENLRYFDLVARWGGDEFLVLAVNVEGLSLQALAERLRQRVKEAETRVGGGQIVQATISVGVADIREGDTAESVSERADSMLLKSKQEGRDRVSFAK